MKMIAKLNSYKQRDKLEQKDAAQEKTDKYADLLNDLFIKAL